MWWSYSFPTIQRIKISSTIQRIKPPLMTRLFTGYGYTARQLHTLLCECVAIPKTSFIRRWEDAPTARDYTMHFVVLSHEQGRGIIPWIQGMCIIPRFSWYYTMATCMVEYHKVSWYNTMPFFSVYFNQILFYIRKFRTFLVNIFSHRDW